GTENRSEATPPGEVGIDGSAIRREGVPEDSRRRANGFISHSGPRPVRKVFLITTVAIVSHPGEGGEPVSKIELGAEESPVVRFGCLPCTPVTVDVGRRVR